MPTASNPDFWRRRRFQWPLAGALALGLATALAVAWSRCSEVVVYNRTGATLNELTIQVCDRSGTFKNVTEGESVRLNLSGTDFAGEIALSTNGASAWRGEYTDPQMGTHSVVLLQRGGSVESRTSTFWLRQLLNSL